MNAPRAALVAAQRAWLARWLPLGPLVDPAAPSPRSLVADARFRPPRPAALRALRGELERCQRDLRDGATWRDYAPPLGRGGTSLGLFGEPFDAPSAWERLDALRDVELSLASETAAHAGLDALAARLGCAPLEALLPCLLCLPALDEARALLRFACTHPALAREPWVRWLGGEDSALAALTGGGAVANAVAYGLDGRWLLARSTLSATATTPRATPVEPGPVEAMVEHLVAQLVTHATDGAPDEAVVTRSLEALFSHWTDADGAPYGDTRVGPRMPAVALYRARFAPDAPALAVLHALRAHVEHVRAPVAKRFVAPAPVLAALAAVARVVAFADDNARTIEREDVDGGVCFTAT